MHSEHSAMERSDQLGRPTQAREHSEQSEHSAVEPANELHRPWADLFPQLLSYVASLFSPDAARYVSLRRTCRGWRHNLTSYNPVPALPASQLPFLLLSPRILPAPLVGNVFRIDLLNHHLNPVSIEDLPQLAGTETSICIGSSHGWIITLDRSSAVSLLNPVTAESIPLQPLSSISQEVLSFHHYDDDPCQYRCLLESQRAYHMTSIVQHAVLSSDPTQDADFTLLIFLSGYKNRCFTCRSSVHGWVSHEYPELSYHVKDVIPMNGVFVSFVEPDEIIIFDFRNQEAGLIMRRHKSQVTLSVTGDAFLVNSGGNLLLVFTNFLVPILSSDVSIKAVLCYSDFCGDDTSIQAVDIAKEPSFDNVALFLSHGCSVAVSLQHFPLISSRIYFVRILPTFVEMEGHMTRQYVAVIYQCPKNLDVRRSLKFEKIVGKELMPHSDTWTTLRAFWVTPNIRLTDG